MYDRSGLYLHAANMFLQAARKRNPSLKGVPCHGELAHVELRWNVLAILMGDSRQATNWI
jgi:hypothetical protein